ncbi:Selenide, water dikinase [Desulfamplus magnetovallimortis]|uniref:Selenide, water dikinase n=1 Tax=Desulfamplus magnetovallimortis TaxID=1246637 RepID=A0A1W1H5U0_9BACT|nr:Selenide, water dikinase [Desulfamplus magnetovallimortis]
MCGLEFPVDENVLVGLGTADDAGVYRVSDELALIQTVDFFTPIVDDPFMFGQIAAANALSDVYAMGGVPKTAMNLVAFPLQKLGKDVLRDVLRGGIVKLKESGTVLVGGHSIEDDEFKYGLSVTGFVHPKKILKNQGLRHGDCIILTKPLGTGIINTAIKGGLPSASAIDAAVKAMAALNSHAAQAMTFFSISACTDVTGFGLLGHLAEMVAGTDTGVTVYSDNIPMLPETEEFASMGLVPAGAHRNREFRKNMVDFAPDFSPVIRDILFDPQTSGGLLMGCPANESESMIKMLEDKGVIGAAIIGVVHDHHPGRIAVKNG